MNYIKPIPFKNKAIIALMFSMVAALAVMGAVGVYNTFESNEPSNVEKLLKKDGFSNIVVKDIDLLCGKVEVSRHFEATDKDGQLVTGTICANTLFRLNSFKTIKTKKRM